MWLESSSYEIKDRERRDGSWERLIRIEFITPLSDESHSLIFLARFHYSILLATIKYEWK